MLRVQDQADRAARFRDLHAAARPLQLANAWDAMSARVLAAAGARAIGTTSFGIALDHGVWDGELLPFDVVLATAEAIASAVDVPVTVDLEAGRGETPADVQRAVEAVIAHGAVGVNIEDSVPGAPGQLRDVDEQAARLAAARAAAAASGIPLFVNARCDVWFGADVPEDARIDEALRRAAAYQVAGADGLFVPGLLDIPTITDLTGRVQLPVNIMVGIGAPSFDDLAAAGVRRVSQGGEPFLAVVGTLKALTDHYLAGELGAPPETVGEGASLIKALLT
ncbi:MAG: isocitrate lyase/phosphoenolpyruvate mutase family protein [Nocardioides sp.]